MSIEITFFIFACFCFVLIFALTRYLKSHWTFTLTFLFMATIILLILYHYGLEQYKVQRHLKAFESTQKHDQCGHFESRHSAYLFGKTQLTYTFKTDEEKILNFNGDALTQHYYPLLTELKKNDRICFRFAENILDWDQHYYLLQLRKEPLEPIGNPKEQ